MSATDASPKASPSGKAAVEREALHQAAEGSWPVLPQERNWGTIGLFAVTLSAGIAAWSYSIGGAVSWYLNASMGTFAMIAGALVGMYFVTLAAMPISVKYGIDTIAACKPQYGSFGAAFGIAAQYLSIVGWNCILIILLGRATANILVAGGVIDKTWDYRISVIVTLITLAVVFWMVMGGADSVRNNSIWIAVAVTIAGLMVLSVLLFKEGWSTVSAGKPIYASGDLHLDFTLGFEILVATVLSWWPYMGGVMRMGRSSRQALFPSMICLGMITGIIALIGLYASLATGDPDPSVFFVKVLGLWMGVIAIIFIALANIGTAIVGIYASAIGLKQIPALQYRLSYRWTTLIVMAPVIVVCALFQTPFMSHILTFMYFLGLVFAPICAVQIVDYYVFRKNILHLPSLFDYSREGRYFFWAGVNPAGFIATGVGFAVYYWLLNPVTYAQHFPFKWISASIPTIIVTGIVYWLLTQFWIIPMKKGGYRLEKS
jgi:NCS1 family nucleobase:cation symporter-1